MMSEHGVPWFSIDALRGGLAQGLPHVGFNFNHDDLEEAQRLWPIVEPMLNILLSFEVDYLVEGSCLRPEDVATFAVKQRSTDFRAVFLGFPNISPEQKVADILQYRVGGNDWLGPEADDHVRYHVERTIRDSQTLATSAAATGLPFFDTGEDFEGAHRRVLAFLCSGAG
jgi:hypothetical protein